MQAVRSISALEHRVSTLFPHFVDAQQSAMRGLRIGWYAMDQDGEIASGPYRGRSECVMGIAESPDAAPALWGRPKPRALSSHAASAARAASRALADSMPANVMPLIVSSPTCGASTK